MTEHISLQGQTYTVAAKKRSFFHAGQSVAVQFLVAPLGVTPQTLHLSFG
ncbi:MAG: hypothetical protein V7K38_18785 [Nostoc sp.]